MQKHIYSGAQLQSEMWLYRAKVYAMKFKQQAIYLCIQGIQDFVYRASQKAKVWW